MLCKENNIIQHPQAVTRLLDNSTSSSASSSSSRLDIEAGAWQQSHSPKLRDRIRAGQQQLGSAIRQLDSIFSAGHIFLRRNPKAQVWALVYLVCLHLWVLYILTSHPTVSETRSGATFSLETLNKTSTWLLFPGMFWCYILAVYMRHHTFFWLRKILAYNASCILFWYLSLSAIKV